MPFDSRISYQSENKLFCISKSLFLRRSVSAKSTEKPLSVLTSTLPSFASFGTEAKGMRSIFSLSSMITAKSPSIRSSEYFNPILLLQPADTVMPSFVQVKTILPSKSVR